MVGWFRKLFRQDLSKPEFVEILESILNRTISDADWDYFVSVRIEDDELEAARSEIEAMWQHKSEYLVPGSVNPTDLTPKGVDKIRGIIDALE